MNRTSETSEILKELTPEYEEAVYNLLRKGYTFGDLVYLFDLDRYTLRNVFESLSLNIIVQKSSKSTSDEECRTERTTLENTNSFDPILRSKPPLGQSQNDYNISRRSISDSTLDTETADSNFTPSNLSSAKNTWPLPSGPANEKLLKHTNRSPLQDTSMNQITVSPVAVAARDGLLSNEMTTTQGSETNTIELTTKESSPQISNISQLSCVAPEIVTFPQPKGLASEETESAIRGENPQSSSLHTQPLPSEMTVLSSTKTSEARTKELSHETLSTSIENIKRSDNGTVTTSTLPSIQADRTTNGGTSTDVDNISKKVTLHDASANPATDNPAATPTEYPGESGIIEEAHIPSTTLAVLEGISTSSTENSTADKIPVAFAINNTVEGIAISPTVNTTKVIEPVLATEHTTIEGASALPTEDIEHEVVDDINYTSSLEKYDDYNMHIENSAMETKPTTSSDILPDKSQSISQLNVKHAETETEKFGVFNSPDQMDSEFETSPSEDSRTFLIPVNPLSQPLQAPSYPSTAVEMDNNTIEPKRGTEDTDLGQKQLESLEPYQPSDNIEEVPFSTNENIMMTKPDMGAAEILGANVTAVTTLENMHNDIREEPPFKFIKAEQPSNPDTTQAYDKTSACITTNEEEQKEIRDKQELQKGIKHVIDTNHPDRIRFFNTTNNVQQQMHRALTQLKPIWAQNKKNVNFFSSKDDFRQFINRFRKSARDIQAFCNQLDFDYAHLHRETYQNLSVVTGSVQKLSTNVVPQRVQAIKVESINSVKHKAEPAKRQLVKAKLAKNANTYPSDTNRGSRFETSSVINDPIAKPVTSNIGIENQAGKINLNKIPNKIKDNVHEPSKSNINSNIKSDVNDNIAYVHNPLPGIKPKINNGMIPVQPPIRPHDLPGVAPRAVVRFPPNDGISNVPNNNKRRTNSTLVPNSSLPQQTAKHLSTSTHDTNRPVMLPMPVPVPAQRNKPYSGLKLPSGPSSKAIKSQVPYRRSLQVDSPVQLPRKRSFIDSQNSITEHGISRLPKRPHRGNTQQPGREWDNKDESKIVDNSFIQLSKSKPSSFKPYHSMLPR